MEKPFLRLVAEHIRDNYKDKTAELCVVLPGKRGAVFLRRYIAEVFAETLWLPTIISTDELISELCGLHIPDEPELVCELYATYKECLGDKAEPFESFAKWGQLILHDFNEIDRYLADSSQLYENLRNIREIENWSLGAEELTLRQQRYLEFMGHLGHIYRSFSKKMLAAGTAWPGLSYRVAAERGAYGHFAGKYGRTLFCGFNALSKSEIKIITTLQKMGAAHALWDADRYYLENTDQEAGHFLRTNLKLFPTKNTEFIGEYFKQEKNISIISVPKQVGQAMVVRETLLNLHREGVPFDRIAVVLADERLLMPVLQLLPAEVEHLNITMEYPLRLSGTYDLIESLLQIHASYAKQQRKLKTIYHKDLSQLLRMPLLRRYMKVKGASKDPLVYVTELAKRNVAFMDWRLAETLFDEDLHVLSPLLREQAAPDLLNNLQEVLASLASSSQVTPIEHEQLQCMLRVFNRVSEIIRRFPFFNETGPLRQLYLQIVSGASVAFVGEPLAGLQVMGVLETRTLDFEHVIMVNVNEGVLPSGKTVNSFIPNDLKRVAGLPLYTEKDAVYAYHFYRLLQRARSVTITYDSETDTFGKGERSRFVTQLLLEMKRYNPRVTINERVAVQDLSAGEEGSGITVPKNDRTLDKIARKAISSDRFGGLSPSGLLTFKACSLRFYLRYGAQVKETDEVEETAEAGTFGSILHLSLEKLYQPIVGQPLSESLLNGRIGEISSTVEESFRTIMQRSEISGKSMLQVEAIKAYVKKLVQLDLRTQSQSGNRAFIVSNLEQELTSALALPGTDHLQIFIKGKIDRIDHYNGMVRIIDYKSSLRSSDRFEFTDFSDLFHDPGYDKMLQLFIYTWMAWKNGIAQACELRPCIIPFKVFAEAPKVIMNNKQPLVFSDELLRDFETELSAFISSIFNRELSFTQTENRDLCEYCAYNVVCNFHP